jgi:hypothetical protein
MIQGGSKGKVLTPSGNSDMIIPRSSVIKVLRRSSVTTYPPGPTSPHPHPISHRPLTLNHQPTTPDSYVPSLKHRQSPINRVLAIIQTKVIITPSDFKCASTTFELKELEEIVGSCVGAWVAVREVRGGKRERERERVRWRVERESG